MRHIAIASILTLTAACHACHDCPTTPDDGPDDSSSSSAGESDGSSDGGGEPAVPYGPCETNEDCPIFPGDKGHVAPEARCFQGTCSYYCGYVTHSSGVEVCPGYYNAQQECPPFYPFGCEDSWCSVNGQTGCGHAAPCPPGMYQGDPRAMPDLGCVWQEPD